MINYLRKLDLYYINLITSIFNKIIKKYIGFLLNNK